MYSYNGLMNIVNTLVSFLIRMAGLAVVATLIWYGIRMATAGGDSAKFTEAKKGFTWALVGAAVIFGVWTIILSIKAFVGSIGQ